MLPMRIRLKQVWKSVKHIKCPMMVVHGSSRIGGVNVNCLDLRYIYYDDDFFFTEPGHSHSTTNRPHTIEVQASFVMQASYRSQDKPHEAGRRKIVSTERPDDRTNTHTNTNTTKPT